MTQPLRSVLCVDDERDILDVARMCLELVGGYQVACCESGQAALDLLSGGHVPDVVLLDVMMPGMNGPETLAAIRQKPEWRDLPVIFMTARVQEAEVRAYLRLGVTAVIPKPFDPMKLPGELATIWNAVNEAREAVAVEGDVEARMAELRVRYVASLAEHVARLEAWHRGLGAGELDGRARGDLKGVAHRLAGTGKTYGFATISVAARLIDDGLSQDADMPAADLAALTDALLVACRAAQAEERPSPGQTAGRKTFGRKAGASLATTAASAPKPTVVVADDDPSVRGLFRELLSDHAHIVEAADTDETLRLMRLHRPALVLLDDIMPGGITGLKLLETLQTSGEFAGVPIIMVTASDSEADIRRGLLAGAAEYITKPFDGARVAASIRARLERMVLKAG